MWRPHEEPSPWRHTHEIGRSFWNMTPCSSLKVSWRFWGTYNLHLQGRNINEHIQAWNKILYSDYYSTLMMEFLCFSETSINFQLATRRHIPEDTVFLNHSCEKLNYCVDLHFLLSNRFIVQCTPNVEFSAVKGWQFGDHWTRRI
jgi:hypothetical protein